MASSDPSRIDELKQILYGEQSTETKALAAFALANIGNAEVCGILMKRGSSGDKMGAICRDALSSVNSPYGQEALLQGVANTSLPAEVRIASVRALSNQDSDRVQTVLINLKLEQKDPSLASEIESTLNTLTQNKAENHIAETSETQSVDEMAF